MQEMRLEMRVGEFVMAKVTVRDRVDVPDGLMVGAGNGSERRVRAGASRFLVFGVLCRALDGMQGLPEDVREGFADVFWDARQIGWEPLALAVSNEHCREQA